MMRLALGLLALSLGGVFVAPALHAQDMPALAGFRLGSDRLTLPSQNCRIVSRARLPNHAPNDKQVSLCTPVDSVALWYADDTLYYVMVRTTVDRSPNEGPRGWVVDAAGHPWNRKVVYSTTETVTGTVTVTELDPVTGRCRGTFSFSAVMTYNRDGPLTPDTVRVTDGLWTTRLY